MGVEETTELVRAELAGQHGPLRDEPDGSASAAVGDRRIHAIALPYGPGAVVQVHTPLVVDVADSDALCEAIATAELTLGRLLLVPGAEDHLRTVLLAHRLLADESVAANLPVAVAATLADADRLEPAFESAFGATWTLEAGE